jgi:hypothetical protein
MAQVRVQIKSWNAEKLLGRSTQILEDFAPVIAEEARRQISLVQWSWDRGTLRFKSIGGLGTRSGNGVYVDPGKRDILDTGRLRDSQQAPIVKANQLSITWTAPYAGLVLKGGAFAPYVNPNGRLIDPGDRPGRNWIGAAFEAEPVLPFFVKRWNELSGASRA